MAKLLTISITDETGKEWAQLKAPAREFKTGNVGFGSYDKIYDPEDPTNKYQCSFNIVKIVKKKKTT